MGIAICLIILFSIGTFYYLWNDPNWNDTLYRSYLSVSWECNPQFSFTENAPNYFLAGTFNSSSNEIVTYTPDESILKHEIVHYVQQKEHRAYFSCAFIIPLYLNEVEAYLGEKMSNEKFIEKYGNFRN